MGLDLQHRLSAWPRREVDPAPQTPGFLHAAGMMILLSAENVGLKAALRQSRRELAHARARIIGAGDRGRLMLERDLHDGAQQRLTAIQIKLRRVQDHALPADQATQLESIVTDVELAVVELRDLARGIYPAVLRDQGLAEAVRSLAIRAPVPVTVLDEGVGRLSATVEAAVYFCIVEALQNATKHAGPHARVTIVLRPRPRRGLQFEVNDDGTGMNIPNPASGLGLMSMRDRIGAVGGELELVSSLGGGTSVRGSIPDDLRPSTRSTSGHLADGWITPSDGGSAQHNASGSSG